MSLQETQSWDVPSLVLDDYVSVTNNHAAGIGTCNQSGMTVPSYLSLEMHLGKFPDRTEFQCWRVNYRTEVCSKAKNHSLALQWIKEIETAKSLDDLITPKSITGKNFSDCEEMALMVAAALRKCYDELTHTSVRKQVSKSSELGRTTDFSEGNKLLT